jgi:hypothetical protein
MPFKIFFGGRPAGAVASGILNATEAPDVAAFAGTVTISGTLATTEGADTAAFAGDFAGVASGILVATEGPDVAAFAGDFVLIPTGILATTESADTMQLLGIFTPGRPVAPPQVPYQSTWDYGWKKQHPHKNKGYRNR